MSSHNIHAGLIRVDGKGVLITGPSGSGKTLLMLHLYRRCKQADCAVHLVSDDQVLLEVRQGRLFGRVPFALTGKIEIRGFGIVNHEQTINQSNIDLAVMLSHDDNGVRFWDGRFENYMGIEIKRLDLSSDSIEACGNAVLAALGQPLWL